MLDRGFNGVPNADWTEPADLKKQIGTSRSWAYDGPTHTGFGPQEPRRKKNHDAAATSGAGGGARGGADGAPPKRSGGRGRAAEAGGSGDGAAGPGGPAHRGHPARRGPPPRGPLRRRRRALLQRAPAHRQDGARYCPRGGCHASPLPGPPSPRQVPCLSITARPNTSVLPSLSSLDPGGYG